MQGCGYGHCCFLGPSKVWPDRGCQLSPSLPLHQGPSPAPCISECLPWDVGHGTDPCRGRGLSPFNNKTIVTDDYLFSK